MMIRLYLHKIYRRMRNKAVRTYQRSGTGLLTTAHPDCLVTYGDYSARNDLMSRSISCRCIRKLMEMTEQQQNVYIERMIRHKHPSARYFIRNDDSKTGNPAVKYTFRQIKSKLQKKLAMLIPTFDEVCEGILVMLPFLCIYLICWCILLYCIWYLFAGVWFLFDYIF
jgi:hypothetical protein